MASKASKLTRRIFIGLAAVLAASLVSALGSVLWFVRRECKRNHSVKSNPVPNDHFRKVLSTRFDAPDLYNLEVVTVDSSVATLTWATAGESEFEIEQIGEGGLRWKESRPCKYHSAELIRLQPDTQYSFRLSETGGGLEEHFSFRTLPDTDEVIFTFGTFTDNHFKHDGFSWPDGRYFRRCSDAHRCLVKDLNMAGADFLINKGDLTDVFEPYRFRAYRDAVRGLEPITHCIPGNHDHLRNKNFAEDWLDFVGTERVYRSFDHKGFHFILLDTCWTGEQKRGYIGDKQISWLIGDLEQNSSRPTLIFTHHPVNGDVQENRIIHDCSEFQRAIAQFPQVAAVFSAHVHRNYITSSPLTPGVPYIETASVIQYPMGYNLYQVSSRGIKQIFKKLSDICLSEESWLASPLRCLTNPGDAMGRPSDRNVFIRFGQPGDLPEAV